jgi:hypothetical protein
MAKKFNARQALVIVFCAMVLLHYGVHSSQAAETFSVVKIHDENSPIVVYDWSTERCEIWDVPDAPVRAFRDAVGNVVAFASDSNNRRFAGPSLLQIRHSCHSSFISRENSDPSAYSGLDFITALWTQDGERVTALIHNEYHADHFPNGCLYNDSMKCWYTTIIGASSIDSAQSFKTAHPPKVVAAVPFRQEFEQGRHRGFFNPSNIIFHNGFFYMASDTTGGVSQKPGLCLFRTESVEDPTSWRGYDGQGFGSRPLDPYRSDTRDYVPCQPISRGTVGSITWHEPSAMFLIVNQTVDASHPNGETIYAWSKDLIHWSEPQTLFAQPDMSSANCKDMYRYGYPSILDSETLRRNFDHIVDHIYLFLTRFHVENCKLSPNRDLIRFQLDITAP